MARNRSGNAGSVRVKSLSREQLTAMEKHGKRLDVMGPFRRVREEDPLVHGTLDLVQALDEHLKGARQSARAQAVALHAFIQWPNNLELTPENKALMLKSSVEFVNRLHGGEAVFAARLDRDEDGEHGVDVFFSPLYEKTTKAGSSRWVSLTKFGKALAKARFGKDDLYLQGRALQDEWVNHLQHAVGLEWAERGGRKAQPGSDWLTPEKFKLQKEREKHDAAVLEMNAAAERNRVQSREEVAKAREEAKVIRAQARQEGERTAESLQTDARKILADAENVQSAAVKSAAERLQDAEEEAKAQTQAAAILKGAQDAQAKALKDAEAIRAQARQDAHKQADQLLQEARRKAEETHAQVLQEVRDREAAAAKAHQEFKAKDREAVQLLKDARSDSKEADDRLRKAKELADQILKKAREEREAAKQEREKLRGLRDHMTGLLDRFSRIALKWEMLEAALLWIRKTRELLSGQAVPGFGQDAYDDKYRRWHLQEFQKAPIEEFAQVEREARLEEERAEARYSGSGPSP